jgi:hypothetical protein
VIWRLQSGGDVLDVFGGVTPDTYDVPDGGVDIRQASGERRFLSFWWLQKWWNILYMLGGVTADP